MIRLFTYSFWIIFIFIYFIIYKYRNSKNKDLFFKTGVYRPLLVTFSLLILSPVIVNFLLPDFNLKLDTVEIIHLQDTEQRSLLTQGKIIDYFLNIVSVIVHNINLVGFISALLILITWFIYIQRIDLFHKEEIKYPLATLFLGMAFSLLTFLISDGVNLLYNITYTGNFFNDLFLYSFLGIGVIEEFVKLIPFFIVLKMTDEINEPYDYILYASLSALGFAFIENLIYFRELNGLIIQGRAMLSVVGHILFSSFAVYGLILARYRHKKSVISHFIIYFLIASFLHGLYDYLLFASLGIIVIIIFIFSIQAWTVIVNNTINNSGFFDFSIIFRAEKLRFFVAVMLSGILVLNYFTNAVQFGKEIANDNYMRSCLYGGLFIVFYVTSLSNYDLVKGYWRPVRFKVSPPDNYEYSQGYNVGGILTLYRGFTSIFSHNFIHPVNIVNYRITLHPPHYNKVLYGIMETCTGKVIDRICLYREDEKRDREIILTDWFLVELDNNLSISEYIDYVHINTHVLIRLESKHDSLIHDEDIRGFMRLIPDMDMILCEKPQDVNFATTGYIFINSIGIPGYTVQPG